MLLCFLFQGTLGHMFPILKYHNKLRFIIIFIKNDIAYFLPRCKALHYEIAADLNKNKARAECSDRTKKARFKKKK